MPPAIAQTLFHVVLCAYLAGCSLQSIKAGMQSFRIPDNSQPAESSQGSAAATPPSPPATAVPPQAAKDPFQHTAWLANICKRPNRYVGVMDAVGTVRLTECRAEAGRPTATITLESVRSGQTWTLSVVALGNGTTFHGTWDGSGILGGSGPGGFEISANGIIKGARYLRGWAMVATVAAYGFELRPPELIP